jgi:hypothetical protein
MRASGDIGMRIGRLLLVVVSISMGFAAAAAQQNSTPPELDPYLNNPKHHKYTAEQAKRVALATIDGKVVGDPTFKYDYGYWVYVVSVKTPKEETRRVWVDSDTGRVVGFDTADKQNGNSKAVQNLKKQLRRPKSAKKKKKTVRRRPVIIIGP